MNQIKLLTSDPRFLLVAEALKEEGFSVERGGEPSREPAVFLFSLGAGEEEVSSLLRHAAPGSLAVVGRKKESVVSLCREKKIALLPLLEDPAYRASNSAATAEGVLAELILKSNRLLGELCVLVVGYGHCGSAIAKLLWLYGCEVWVQTGEKSTPRAENDGFCLFPQTHSPGMFDAVINTVEAPIFSEEFLQELTPGTIFFQVASGFSGLCADRMAERDISFYPLPGLPGRVAQKTEAEAILRALFPWLKKEVCVE